MEVWHLNVIHVHKTVLIAYQIVSISVYANSYNVALYESVQQKVSKYCTVISIFVCVLRRVFTIPNGEQTTLHFIA